eukprot:8577070-Alexandrium_andersonii.AAC.1
MSQAHGGILASLVPKHASQRSAHQTRTHASQRSRTPHTHTHACLFMKFMALLIPMYAHKISGSGRSGRPEKP